MSASLYPPRHSGLFLDHNVAQERHRFRKSLFRRKQAVFMFDGQYVVITKQAQRGNKFAPPRLSMAIAASAEDPTPVSLVRIRLRVENTGQRQIGTEDLRVFRMHVEDCIPKYPNRSN